MKKKKVAVFAGVIVLLAAIGGAGYYYRDQIMEMVPFLNFARSDDRVYVEKVGKIMNQFYGVANRYNGVVEAQDTYDVNVDTDRTIKEVLVSVGDTVEVGQQLVIYDTQEIEMQKRQAELELQSMQNEIATYRKQIEVLRKERDTVAEADKFSYTTEIQSLENNIEQSNFDLESKQLEIDKYQEQITDSIVVSKNSGIVRTINESGYDDNGNTVAFMTVQQAGGYRIKGSISEQNVWNLEEGQTVIIHSRVNADVTWDGVITKIDRESTMSGNNNGNMGYDSYEGAESATKYPFYVEVQSQNDLMLGQHVYMELDEGQKEEKEGLWLYSYYIVFEDDETAAENMFGELETTEMTEMVMPEMAESIDSDSTETAPVRKAYVWAANEKNRIEKRYITLGQYDAELDEYEILDGLTEEDYIAWPMEGLYEGVITVTNEEDIDYSSPLYNSGEDTETNLEDYDYDTDGLDLDSMDGIDGMETDDFYNRDTLELENGDDSVDGDYMDDLEDIEDVENIDDLDDNEGEEI